VRINGEQDEFDAEQKGQHEKIVPVRNISDPLHAQLLLPKKLKRFVLML
jgi:hypothetical protein